jgi:hypothetical protein
MYGSTLPRLRIDGVSRVLHRRALANLHRWRRAGRWETPRRLSWSVRRIVNGAYLGIDASEAGGCVGRGYSAARLHDSTPAIRAADLRAAVEGYFAARARESTRPTPVSVLEVVSRESLAGRRGAGKRFVPLDFSVTLLLRGCCIDLHAFDCPPFFFQSNLVTVVH